MRDFKGMKRQRGRNRGGGQGGGKPQQNINRAFDSNGPENIKIRGHAQHVYEKYSALARDASSGGDPVLAENYLQHAEHYFRTLRAIQPNRPASEIAARDSFTAGMDIDFEDEALETAMEAADAQAAERAAGGGQPALPAAGETSETEGERPSGGERANGQDRFEGRRDRWRDEGRGENRGDRQGQNGGEREFRRDRDDRYRDRDRSDGGDRQNGDRQNGERQNADRQSGDRQNGDRPNGEFRRDRGDFRRDREDRFRDRGDSRSEGRDDRPRFDRDRPRYDREPGTEERADASTTDAPAEAATGAVLRSRDGEESHAPAFLGAPAAPPPESEEGDAAPRRTRTRRRARAEDPAPETEEA